ncbi:MAG: hypothetical protein A2Y34_03575, partial [Spirochaetes bacterium GWC1_27_15]
HEVYYNKNNEIVSWTEKSILPYGESLVELRNDIFYFMSAFKYPVLKETEKNGDVILIEDEIQKTKLTKWHHFEVMDRMSVVLSHFDDFVASHPVIRKDKKLQKKSQKISGLMYKFYNKLSGIFFK